MNDPGLILLSIIALCVPVFGLIIYYGLKNRQHSIEKWIDETDAALVLSQTTLCRSDIHSMLYGNYYDASMSRVALLIKDRSDREIGKTIYETGSTTITTDGEEFRVFSELQSNFHITVRPVRGKGSLEPQIAECTCRGILAKRFQYNFRNYGKIDVQHRSFSRRATIEKDGVIIGEWFRLGPYELSGKALVLSTEIPVIFQMILLSGPFIRQRGVSY